MSFLKKFSYSKISLDEIQDVMDNLSHILRTKQQYGAAVADLGIADLTHYSHSEDIVRNMIAEIRSTVEKYEPRVNIIDIAPLGGRPLQIHLHCRVKKHNVNLNVLFCDRLNTVSIQRRRKG